MTTAAAADGLTPPPPAPAADRIDPKKLAIFLTMVVGMFMAVLDIQIVAASLADIQAGLAASADQISWVQTSYLIAEVMMIPISGYLTRSLSTRVMFSISAAGFAISSLACGLSTSMEMLIVMRAIQGFIGGAMIPTVFATSITAFPRSRAMQISAGIGLIVTLAPTIGPTLGGWISQSLSWHWLFFVNVAPGFMIASVVWLYADFDKPDLDRLKRFDFFGFLLMAVALGLTEYILEEGPGEDWFADRWITIFTIIALGAGLAFFFRQRRSDHPIVEFAAYRNINFVVGSIAAATLGVALFGLVYVLPLFLARIEGYNALQIGETLFVTGGAMFLTAPFAATLSRKFDPRLVSASGLVLLAGATHALTGVTAEWGYWNFFWPQVARGAGLMLTMAPLNVIALGTLEPALVPGASGLYNLARNLGGAFGLAIINMILTDRTAFHTRVLADFYNTGRPAFTERLAAITAHFQAEGVANPDLAALQVLANFGRREAATLAFADVFIVITVVCLITAPLFILASPPDRQPAPGGH